VSNEALRRSGEREDEQVKAEFTILVEGVTGTTMTGGGTSMTGAVRL
jgi:hypothetical protein